MLPSDIFKWRKYCFEKLVIKETLQKNTSFYNSKDSYPVYTWKSTPEISYKNIYPLIMNHWKFKRYGNPVIFSWNLTVWSAECKYFFFFFLRCAARDGPSSCTHDASPASSQCSSCTSGGGSSTSWMVWVQDGWWEDLLLQQSHSWVHLGKTCWAKRER